MNERDTIPGAQKLAQFEPCPFMESRQHPGRCQLCGEAKSGHGQPMTCKQAGAIGGRATGPNKRRTRAHYRRANKIRWAKFRAEKAKEAKP